MTPEEKANQMEVSGKHGGISTPKDCEITYSLILDLRNALAAAMRILASDDFHGVRIDAFLEEVRRLGIKDGVGVRADKWLKKEERRYEKKS